MYDGQIEKVFLDNLCENYKKNRNKITASYVKFSDEDIFFVKNFLSEHPKYFEEIVPLAQDLTKEIAKKHNKQVQEFIEEQFSGVNKLLNIDKKYDEIAYLLLPYYSYSKASYNNERFLCYAKPYFSILRELLNRINLKKISPDIIILDEFHKYLSSNVKNKLEEYLKLVPNTKILFVSATPYKMSINSREFFPDSLQNDIELNDTDEAIKKTETREVNDSCFSGYLDLYKYLSNSRESREIPLIRTLESDLISISTGLMKLHHIKEEKKFVLQWKACMESKKNAEGILKEHIVRTERHTLSRDNALTAKNSSYVSTTDFAGDEECINYEAFQFRNIYLTLEKNLDSVLMYTKMSPFPLSFSKNYQSLGWDGKVLENYNKYDACLFWDGRSQPEHYRFRILQEKTLSESVKKALWIPPSNIDKNDLVGFWKDVADYTKTLVFARHIMTTESVSAILSTQILNSKYDLPNEIFEFNENDCIHQFFKNASHGYIDENDVFVRQIVIKFYSYLEANKNVLANAEVKNKEDLFKYCTDGRLEDVLKEYFFVLAKQHKALESNHIETITKALDINTSSITYLERPDNILAGMSPTMKTKVVKCSFAEKFNGEATEDTCVTQQENLQIKFNSPFYPFVLITTPIAQEGINLQNYCHRIIHWRTPVSPVDYEQREGRINRYRNHAVRKSLAKNTENKASWTTIFDREETKEGLAPNWIADVVNPIKIESLFINHPYSKDSIIQKSLEKSINSYRVSLGYGVKQDVLDKIELNAKALSINNLNFEDILLNLAP